MLENRSSVSLSIAGRKFKEWKSFSASFDMENLAAVFNFSLYDRTGDLVTSLISGSELSRVAEPGLPCDISISNELVPTPTPILKGYITQDSASLDGTSSGFSINGADRLVDLLDCSVIHESKSWTKKRFVQIIADLASPFSIPIVRTKLSAFDPLIDRFAVQSGEAPFDAIERLCRSQAVLPASTYAGALELTYAAPLADRAVRGLVVGDNVLRIRRSRSWEERFSEYTAIGQADGSGAQWTAAMLSPSAVARDTGVTRYRPLIIIAENRATQETLLKRVQWEATIRSGRATEFSTVVQGWYQMDVGGRPVRPWVKNERVNLKCSDWGVDLERLITRVDFSLDDAGELTTLTLKHPDVFQAQPGATVDLV